jgi:predicted AAA+ superfamily ATPase
LLPFSATELKGVDRLPAEIDDMLFQGAYPPIYDRGLEPSIWYANYVQTYLERDVRQLINVRDLGQFQKFLRLCAGRSGQLLNLSALGDEAGVSHNTARDWISVLEASFIVFRLPPFYRNYNKRLVKTPKLYFYDVGLVSWLLGIERSGQVGTHPLRGALFETWVVGEFMKKRLNSGRPANLSFWRDRAGHEIDLLVPDDAKVRPIEIKSGATINRDALRGLGKWAEVAGAEAGRPALIYAGSEMQQRGDVDILPWNAL